MYGYTRTEDRIAQNRWRKEKYGKNKTKTSPTPAATQQGETGSANAKSDSTAGVPQTVVVTGDDVFTHGNEYTTTAQRKKQQHSLNEIFKEKSSYTAADKKRDENINNYLYGNKDKPKSDNVFKDFYSTSKEKQKTTKSSDTENSSFLQKVENQSVNYADIKTKSVFDFMDNFAGYKGPNQEIAETVKLKKDKNFSFDNYIQSAGPNKEMSAVRLQGNPANLKKELNSISKTKGPNSQISKTTYLDPRGQNAAERFLEERNYKKLSETADKTVVTKDNVYYQPPKKLESVFTDLQNSINERIKTDKRELEDLQFSQKFVQASENKKEYDSISSEIKSKKEDIEKLRRIERKIRIGRQFNYQFMENQTEKLSQENIDDILKSNEEFGYNLPYFSPVAQGARAVNQGVGKTKTAVDIVNGLNVRYNHKNDDFTFGDTNNPNGGFKFSTDEVHHPKGYKEHKIIADKSNIKNLDNIQYDILKAIDGKTISDNTLNTLKKLANNNDMLKSAGKNLGYAGAGLDIIDFAFVVDADLRDDGNLGTDFSQEFFGTAANWAGDYAGGVAGVKAGAAMGTVALGPVGTIIDGALGAAFGAYILSSVMEDIGRYVGENINESDYTIEQYHQRAK